MRIHQVFHVSLPEPAPDNAELLQNVEREPEEEFEVEEIQGIRKLKNQWKYLV